MLTCEQNGAKNQFAVDLLPQLKKTATGSVGIFQKTQKEQEKPGPRTAITAVLRVMTADNRKPNQPETSSSSDPGPGRFVRLFTENERRIRIYLFSLLPGRNEVDEVMQEVSRVLWEKFEQLQDDAGFLPWAYTIARYEVLMYRRTKARDRLVFSESTLLRITEDFDGEDEHVRDTQRLALDQCLAKLADADRRLLMTAYSNETKISEVAVQMNLSSNSLYKSLNRLRQRLVKCMQLGMQGTEI